MKRKREDEGPESSLPAPPASAGLPAPPPPLTDSPRRRRERSRDFDRKYGDRPRRDPRDEFEDGPRPPRSASARLRSPHGSDRRSTPPVRFVPLLVRRCRHTNVLFRRPSPTYDQLNDDPLNEEPREDDSEARSVFVSQLAARLTARDLGYFFEDKLGEGSVMDSRIVTDRISRRSKG